MEEAPLSFSDSERQTRADVFQRLAISSAHLRGSTYSPDRFLGALAIVHDADNSAQSLRIWRETF